MEVCLSAESFLFILASSESSCPEDLLHRSYDHLFLKASFSSNIDGKNPATKALRSYSSHI